MSDPAGSIVSGLIIAFIPLFTALVFVVLEAAYNYFKKGK